MEIELKNVDGDIVLQAITHGELFMHEGILYQKLKCFDALKKILPNATFIVASVKTGQTSMMDSSAKVVKFTGRVIATRA